VLEQLLGIDGVLRIQWLDFDVELLREPCGHAAQLGQRTAHANLTDRRRRRANGPEEFRQLVGEPPRDVVDSPRLGVADVVDVTPRQLACGNQRAVPNERDTRRGFVERHVRFDRPRHGELAPCARQ
jgi:hypothetical protein